jgi:hypothetical protein
MFSRLLKPFVLIAAFVLLVGLACNALSGGTTNPPPVQVQPTSEQPTQPPVQIQPTAEPPTAEPPTAESPASSEYYTEEFDGNIDSYTYFEYHEMIGKAEKDESIIPTAKDGFLVFDLKKTNKWVYVTYDSYTYGDVKIEISADNRAKNTNNISLICRYSEEGWYEFNIANSGLYQILAYDATGAVSKGYNLIADGASTAIRQGKDINVYTAICEGEKLSLYINGVEVRTISDRKYRFRDGKVGFGVSSFEVTPILVEVDWFKISQP